MAQQPQAKLSGWGSVAKQPAMTKSLLEIQREEAQQMKQRKEQQPHQHPTVTQQTRPQTRTVREISDSRFQTFYFSSWPPVEQPCVVN